MFNKSFTLLLVFFAALLCANAARRQVFDTADVAAHPDDFLSNGERFKRGLGPRQPARLYEPSKLGAPLARRSVDPSTFVRIAATDVNGAIAGYMVIWKGKGIAGLTSPSSDADKYTPNGQGNQQTIFAYLINYQVSFYLRVASPNPGNIGNGPGVGRISGSALGTAAFDIPQGFPGPISIAYTNTDASVGYPKVYWQKLAGTPGYLWLANSAATVNAALGAGTVSESDLVTLAFTNTL